LIPQASDNSSLRFLIPGIGIPAEDQTKIFERFYQVNEGGAHKEVGSGIGLALVKQLTRIASRKCEG
jgi:signal transduction histidine kinase